MKNDIVIEDKILDNLVFNAEYARKVVPFLKEEYFQESTVHKEIVKQIIKFYAKYTDTPTKETLLLEFDNVRGINDKTMNEIREKVNSLHPDDSNFDWLIESTEKFCQNQAMYLAIVQGADALLTDESKRTMTNAQIYKAVTDALAVSFDSNMGHDYFEEYEKRFEAYHQSDDKISWGINCLDRISNGGMSKKNLLCAVAPTGSGKSLFMCSVASNAIRNGNNVLYISLEMSETRVAERIDANLMSDKISKIQNLTLSTYRERCEKLNAKKHGKLIIKEFPTSSANVTHFKTLLDELRIKKNFVPDLIVVDYLNICASARVRPNQTNSYGLIKAISEELRGLAVERNVAILTATQVNRQGMESSDIDMTNVSESFGITFVMDMFFALIRTEALDAVNQMSIKQLKNRYSDLTLEPTITVGVNRDHMMVYDLDSNSNGSNPKFYQSELPKFTKTNGGITYTQPKVAPKNDFEDIGNKLEALPDSEKKNDPNNPYFDWNF